MRFRPRARADGAGQRSPRALLPLALAVALAPLCARAETLGLHDLLGSADRALDVLMAEAEYDSAQAEFDRTRAEKGWKLSVQGGYGAARDIVDETRSRSYDAIETKVSVTYPLLGAYAKEQRLVEIADGKLKTARLRREAALKAAQLHLEDLYAAYWGAQEGVEVADAYLATRSRLGAAANDDDYAQARVDRNSLQRRKDDARVRLEKLVGRPLTGLVATPVQLPAIPDLDLRRLQNDEPDLAGLRVEYASLRRQLDDSIWWGVDAGFDLTQTTVTDRTDGQAGNGLFANFNVSMPLTFYEAGLHERRRLRAEMQALELKIRGKGDEIAANAQNAQAEHKDLYDLVQRLTRRAKAAGEALERPAAGAPDTRARRLHDYYRLAMDELDARTRYWRSHVEMRSYLLVGAAEPAPEPTGPDVSDLGATLAEPLRQAFPGR